MRTVTQFNILTASIDDIEKLQTQLANKTHHVVSVSERDEHLIFRLANPVNVVVPRDFFSPEDISTILTASHDKDIPKLTSELDLILSAQAESLAAVEVQKYEDEMEDSDDGNV